MKFDSIVGNGLLNFKVNDQEEDEFDDLILEMRNELKMLKEDEGRILADIEKTINCVEKTTGFFLFFKIF